MDIHNNTSLSLEQIRQRAVVGVIRNNWRKRTVTLYVGDAPNHLYMVGVAYDQTIMVISHEEIGLNEETAMSYWRHGEKILTRD